MNRRRSRHPRSRGDTADGRHATHHGSGQLRLIGGRFRRRKLPILDSPGLRPTPDRVRETLFNWLAFELAGRRVLDLYAGTGALGLEALSRGAAQVTFVEMSPAVAGALEANLRLLGIEVDAVETRAVETKAVETKAVETRVLNADVVRYLASAPAPFDLVFLDPPFRRGLAATTCERLESAGWLAPDALIYVESEHELAWQPPTGWQLHREIVAGDSHGRLFRRTPAGN